MREQGPIVWFTGLPSSGKSTLARRVQRRLSAPAVLLDGDEVRAALVPRPGYGPAERDAFYASLANLALLLSRQGLTVLVAATAHRRAYREAARAVAPRFIEVLLSVSLQEAKVRDQGKGIYSRADLAQTEGPLPGVDVEYEPPPAPEVVASGGEDEQAVERICALLEPGR